MRPNFRNGIFLFSVCMANKSERTSDASSTSYLTWLCMRFGNVNSCFHFNFHRKIVYSKNEDNRFIWTLGKFKIVEL